jgi:hypothetical protein
MTVAWCLVKIEYSENTRHLVEVFFRLAETLFQFDTVENQRNLHPTRRIRPRCPAWRVRPGHQRAVVRFFVHHVDQFNLPC